MFAYGIDDDTAFSLMREHSQHVNRKVRDLAADLVGSLSQRVAGQPAPGCCSTA
jgi:ANTAR domain